jgi:hypothetical protein
VDLRQEQMHQRRIRTNTSGLGRIQHLKQKFDACKEKETFKEARQDILKDNIVSTSGTNPMDDIQVYDMPPLFD